MGTAGTQGGDADGKPVPEWSEISRVRRYERYGRALDEVVLRLPSGGDRTFSLKVERPSVAVLALTATGQVVITRQFRPGPGRVLFELPGGYIDPGEGPTEAAARELREETGFTGRLRRAGECYSDAYSNALKQCVVATDAKMAHQPSPDAEEFISVSLIPVPHFRAILRSGMLTDTDMGYMALDFLGLL